MAMAERGSADNAARKQALHHRVQTDVPIGLLGYLDNEPVGWCSVAPRESFLRLSSDQDDGETGIWSITCFFVRRDHRKAGLEVSHQRAPARATAENLRYLAAKRDRAGHMIEFEPKSGRSSD